ncbi:hypothetical protein Tco_0454104 [Tanacetum coccineum]
MEEMKEHNSLIELRFEEQELLKVINNTPIIDCEVKGVTTRGGKTTTQDAQKNDTNIHTKEPLAVNHDELVESNEVLINDQPQKTNKPDVQPSDKIQTHLTFPEDDEGKRRNQQKKSWKPEAAPHKLLCSAVLLNKLLLKEKDPWSFTIPCDIGQLHINIALADLGANISLMPYTMYEKLRNDPFLATARAMIDVFNKKITLRVGDDEVIFDVDQSIKRLPTEDDECYGIDDLVDMINVEA